LRSRPNWRALSGILFWRRHMRSRWMALALLFAAACLVAGCTGSGRFLQVQKFGTETELRTFCQQRGEMVELEMRVNDAENPTTFEQAYLKDGTGRMIFPSTINVIEEWGEATVWVRWSATKYQNGVPVWHNEGESFDSWSWRNPTKVTRADGEPVVEMPPAIWERLKRKTPAEGPRCVKLLRGGREGRQGGGREDPGGFRDGLPQAEGRGAEGRQASRGHMEGNRADEEIGAWASGGR
jgi:hypothetical protein